MMPFKYASQLKRVLQYKSLQSIYAFIIGAVFGIFSSYTVNCTLVEITINSVFSTYFGILFILLGILILWRVLAGDHTSQHTLQSTLLLFSILVLICGCLCFILDSTYVKHLSYLHKLPLYIMLGISVAFALLFSCIDLLNYIIILFNLSAKSFIANELQLYCMICTSILLGMTYGAIFGLLDVEDSKLSELQYILVRDESISSIIGAFISGCAAVINTKLYNKSTHNNTTFIQTTMSDTV